MGDIIVEGVRLSMSYGKHHVVLDMNFGVDAGDGIVGMLGSDGTEEATLLKAICGGIEGCDIGRYDGMLRCPNRDEVTYLPDEPFLFSWMTVRQATDLSSTRRQDFRNDVAEELLAESAVRRSTPMGSLSKKMSERLHLALTVTKRLRLYVSGEPSAGINPLTRDRWIKNIVEVRRQEAPMLLSTHLIGGVKRVLDAVMMVVDGRLFCSEKVVDIRQIDGGFLEMAFERLVAAHG